MCVENMPVMNSLISYLTVKTMHNYILLKTIVSCNYKRFNSSNLKDRKLSLCVMKKFYFKFNGMCRNSLLKCLMHLNVEISTYTLITTLQEQMKNVSISYQTRLRREIIGYAYVHHFKVQRKSHFVRGPNFKVLMERLFLEA